jgi:G3E family GTPase
MLQVYLLTGFLGSGKTTVLQRLIAQPDFPRARTALLINDAGPLNIDAKLFRGKSAAISALTGGCACCSTGQELVQELHKFARDPSIDLAWIEASGAASTEDLLDRLTDSSLLTEIELTGVLHVVDAANYPLLWFGRASHQEQFGWADLVLINKVDLAKPAAVTRIEEDVVQVNPRARIVHTVRGEFDFLLPTASRIAGKPIWTRSPHPQYALACWVELPHPVPQPTLVGLLDQLPPEVYRAKGFVRFTHQPEKVHVVHKVGTQSETMLWEYNDPSVTTGLVLLGKGLDPAALQKHFSPESFSLCEPGPTPLVLA